MISFLPPSVRLEELRITAPLGLRFLDTGTNEYVREGLRVIASPADDPRIRLSSRKNPSGIHFYITLPGFDPYTLDPASTGNASPPAFREFRIEVVDSLNRFLPCVFSVNAPSHGFASLAEGTAPWIAAETIPLFSSPGRTLPPGLGIVRMQLTEATSGRPAAWALAEISYLSRATASVARGMADDRGEMLVVFPTPEGQRRGFNSSPPASTRGLQNQEWPLALQFFHRSVQPPEAAANYSLRLSQPRVNADFDQSPLSPAQQATLRFGSELVIDPIALSSN